MSAEIVPFAAVSDFKDLLGIEDLASEGELISALREGTEMIVDYCRRDFHLSTETRTFDAPPGDILIVDDLQAVTGIVVRSTSLTTPEYVVLPLAGKQNRQQIIRLSTDTYPKANRWDAECKALKLPPYGVVQIAGTWAYQASYDSGTHVWTEIIPERVRRANLVLAARLWQKRDLLYADSGSTASLGRKQSPQGVMSSDVEELLNSFVRESVRMVIGVLVDD